MQWLNKFKKLDHSTQLLVGLGTAIIVLLLIFGLAIHSTIHSKSDLTTASSSSNKSSQPSSMPKPKLKANIGYGYRKNYHMTVISITDGQQVVTNGINIGMHLIQVTKAVPNQNMNLMNLSDTDQNQLYSAYQNASPVQQFNDFVNYSSPLGYLQHGDAGNSKGSQEATPKPGDPYTVDNCQVNYQGSDDTNRYYTAKIQYHGANCAGRTLTLKFTVSKTIGRITGVDSAQ